MHVSLQLLGRVDVHGHVVVVEVQHDGQGDGRLGRRQHDHEQGEDLPFDLEGRVEVGEGDEVDVGPVEHQLDAHEHADGVALGRHADDAADEQQRAEQQVVRSGRSSIMRRPPRRRLARAR